MKAEDDPSRSFHTTARLAERVMRRAVRDEIAKKAKLGQYVVINRNRQALPHTGRRGAA